MFKAILNDDERGQVGIGTLIVFIAMVLVAAIAAGVLINTAGFLQSQAEATGQDSTDLVSERIEVTSSVGIVGSESDGELEAIKLTVTGAPGADQIDLSETTIQAVGPNGQANLVFTAQEADDSTSVDPSADNYATRIDKGEFAVLKDGTLQDGSQAVISDNEQYTIVLNPAAEPFGDLDGTDTSSGVYDSSTYTFAHGDSNAVFGQSDQSSVEIVSPAGATTSVELRAPDLFNTNGEAVRL